MHAECGKLATVVVGRLPSSMYELELFRMRIFWLAGAVGYLHQDRLPVQCKLVGVAAG